MTRLIDIKTSLGAKAVVLTHLTVSEGLSRLGDIRVRLKSRRSDIKVEEVLGKNATVRLDMSSRAGRREPRFFNGYVTRWSGANETVDAVNGANKTKAYHYEAVLHSWLWFLSRQSNSRIFQNKTVLEILKSVFEGHGSLASFELKTSRSYLPLRYCCQYRETDFNFVSRLMEQEGIYYYFRHESGRHTLVLADSISHHTAQPNYERVNFDTDDDASLDSLSTWNGAFEIQPGRYVVEDYNPEVPRTRVTGSATASRPHQQSAFEMYDYPAEVDTPDAASRAAGMRLDELQSQHQVFEGAGSVRGLMPGRTFELKRHPVSAFNTKYLVVGITLSCTAPSDTSGGGGGDLHTSVAAIPASQQFRPMRITPKPIVTGPQTAVVVGPKGEEIYTDDKRPMSTVKVQFPWDRYGVADENSSCWIRVASIWAGNGYGAMLLPRIGQEVVVEFLEGDPDRPIIVGSVYNGVNKPPFKLPDEKTRWGFKSRSTKGGGASNFNELRFEDKKGSEEIYVHAERDHTVYVKHDRKAKVLNESHLDVAKNDVSKFGADVHVDIVGDHIAKTGAGVHLTTGQDWQGKIGTKFAVDSGQEVHLKAGVNVVIEAGTQLTLKVGGNFITIGPAGVFIKGTMVMVNSGGSAGSGSGASPRTPLGAALAPPSAGGTDAPISRKAAALKAARASSVPFCEICNT